MEGTVVSINISEKKGTRKTPVGEASVLGGHGIEGDAHASGGWHRQVSLLAIESIEKMRKMGLNVGPGDFAENITTEGINLLTLPVGTRLSLGDSIEAEVSQIGKVCHDRCEIYRQAGDCVMPKEGIFVKVIKGGKITVGDRIKRLKAPHGAAVITACVLTLSDKGFKGLREDSSGPLIGEILSGIGAVVSHSEILPDEGDLIREKLIEFSGKVDVILTTGGTGLSPRDVTPDATLAVIEKEVPGIAEAMRTAGMNKTGRAMLSRAVAGVRAGTLIINLPGSPGGVKDGLEAILAVIPHAVEKLKGSDRECAHE